MQQECGGSCRNAGELSQKNNDASDDQDEHHRWIAAKTAQVHVDDTDDTRGQPPIESPSLHGKRCYSVPPVPGVRFPDWK